MLIQTKIQIDKKEYEFSKQAYKELRYKNLSEYVQKAVHAKVEESRRRLRELKRKAAMAMIGRARYKNIYESKEWEDFESR
jgi:hypothetical protein